MTTTAEPADTTMMRIVHDALRRDLDRARSTLGDADQSDREQRRAIASHLRWMMRFLHAHHASEDDGLYPLLRDRAADAPEHLAVIDRMTEQHRAIAPALRAVDDAAADLEAQGTDDARIATMGALEDLVDVLVPHLRQEEDEAMPIAAHLITAAEWQAIEQEHNLDPKSMSDLGFEGHWLIDGASDADREVVTGLVPPLPRFILLHGFARRYRRHASACWGAGAKPPRRVQLQNKVSVTVDADLDDVWAVVCDVTRVGEWSHECVGAEWLGDPAAAVPGARFRGRNRSGIFRWGRACEIVSAAPHELVWRTVPTAFYPDSSEWRINLERVDGHTTISQAFQVLRAPKALSVLYATVIPGHRDRTAALTEDLRRLGTVASRPRAAA